MFRISGPLPIRCICCWRYDVVVHCHFLKRWQTFWRCANAKCHFTKLDNLQSLHQQILRENLLKRLFINMNTWFVTLPLLSKLTELFFFSLSRNYDSSSIIIIIYFFSFLTDTWQCAPFNVFNKLKFERHILCFSFASMKNKINDNHLTPQIAQYILRVCIYAMACDRI